MTPFVSPSTRLVASEVKTTSAVVRDGAVALGEDGGPRHAGLVARASRPAQRFDHQEGGPEQSHVEGELGGDGVDARPLPAWR